jgi:hypothetical protein
MRAGRNNALKNGPEERKRRTKKKNEKEFKIA